MQRFIKGYARTSGTEAQPRRTVDSLSWNRTPSPASSCAPRKTTPGVVVGLIFVGLFINLFIYGDALPPPQMIGAPTFNQPCLFLPP
jgi:hypothetical protein